MTRAQRRAWGGGGQEAAVVPWTLCDGQDSGQRLDLQGKRVPGLLYIQSTAGHTAGLGRAFCPGPGAAGAVGGRRRQDWPGPRPGRPARRAAGTRLLRGHGGCRAEKTPDAEPLRTPRTVAGAWPYCVRHRLVAKQIATLG